MSGSVKIFKPQQALHFGTLQKRKLRAQAHEFFWQFNAEVKRQTKRSYFKAPPVNDQIRLLTLKVWMVRHKVRLDFIVRILVTYWQKKFEHKIKKQKYGIGVGIATLTGRVSEQILISVIGKEFPHEENVIEWRSTMQMLRLRRPVVKVTGEDFAERYEHSIRTRQAQLDTALGSGKYKRRMYRDNPWV